jgi:hypothetical protein
MIRWRLGCSTSASRGGSRHFYNLAPTPPPKDPHGVRRGSAAHTERAPAELRNPRTTRAWCGSTRAPSKVAREDRDQCGRLHRAQPRSGDEGSTAGRPRMRKPRVPEPFSQWRVDDAVPRAARGCPRSLGRSHRNGRRGCEQRPSDRMGERPSRRMQPWQSRHLWTDGASSISPSDERRLVVSQS